MFGWPQLGLLLPMRFMTSYILGSSWNSEGKTTTIFLFLSRFFFKRAGEMFVRNITWLKFAAGDLWIHSTTPSHAQEMSTLCLGSSDSLWAFGVGHSMVICAGNFQHVLGAHTESHPQRTICNYFSIPQQKILHVASLKTRFTLFKCNREISISLGPWTQSGSILIIHSTLS